MASTPAASPPTPYSNLEKPTTPPESSKLNSAEEVQEINVQSPSSNSGGEIDKENVGSVSNFNNNNVK